MPSYDLGRLAMTLGHLGALLLFVRSGALPWLRRSLAAVGQLASRGPRPSGRGGGARS